MLQTLNFQALDLILILGAGCEQPSILAHSFMWSMLTDANWMQIVLGGKGG